MLVRALLAAALLATPAVAALPAVVTAAPAGALIVSDHSGFVVSLNVTTAATAGYVMLFDSATIPADGAIVFTNASRLLKCFPLAATTGFEQNYRMDPVAVGVGAVVVFSSGANCFTVTKSATAFISGEAR